MPQKPNVIICMSDQLRTFEVGYYGNPVIQTPNLDRLAGSGVRFEQAVTNNPVCMPARSCLLSGQYSRTCMGSLGNHIERGADGVPFMPEYPVEERVHFPERTLAEQLQSAGYDTALIGKWHIQPAPGLIGFDTAVYPRVHHRHTGQTFIENRGAGDVVPGFSVDYEVSRVAQYLRTPRDKPYFLFYNISPPHMPLFDAPERYLTMYAPEQIPLRPNVLRGGKPAYDEHWFRIYLWDFLYYQEHLPHAYQLPAGFDLRHLSALYYGMTTWVDDMVGKLLHELEATGQADNTIVVFVSDHGDNLGSHHTFNKDTLMEESIRIPMLLRWTQHWQPRVVSNHVAQLIDLMPTLLHACGAEIPVCAQGRDLSDVLDGKAEQIGDGAAVIETSNGMLGIRTPTHLYGARLDTSLRNLTNDEKVFFDLRSDPYEMTNLAAENQQSALANALHEQLVNWNTHTPWMKG